MKILVTGSSGLIGSALVPALEADGHDVMRLVRRPPRNDAEVAWSPADGEIGADGLEGLDAAVHLAGENIASARWSEAKKARIRDSRVQGTRLLAETLGALDAPPKTLVSASAIGTYGDRGDQVLTEEAQPGDNFLAQVCQDWEAAAAPAAEAGIRVVNPRIGIVLSPDGGVLGRMLTPFRLGLGGHIGRGRQYMRWIALDDLIGVIRTALSDEALEGPVNAVAPNPVTNHQFAKALGRVLRRPAILHVPAFVLRIALGQMADELLLASARVAPSRLIECGFSFQYAELEAALRHLLGKADE
jgi:hypothetical protein